MTEDELLNKISELKDAIECLAEGRYKQDRLQQETQPSAEQILTEMANVRNEFVQSLRLQWMRGAEFTPNQLTCLRKLYENHCRSIERGFRGIDEGVSDRQWLEIQRKLGLVDLVSNDERKNDEPDSDRQPKTVKKSKVERAKKQTTKKQIAEATIVKAKDEDESIENELIQQPTNTDESESIDGREFLMNVAVSLDALGVEEEKLELVKKKHYNQYSKRKLLKTLSNKSLSVVERPGEKTGYIHYEVWADKHHLVSADGLSELVESLIEMDLLTPEEA